MACSELTVFTHIKQRKFTAVLQHVFEITEGHGVYDHTVPAA